MKMAYPIENNEKDAVKNYFDSLPEYLRENIKQSDVDFDTVEELKLFAENMMNNHN